jgi:hypothetical protein
VWRWNGSSWDEEIIGALPGTTAPFGLAVCRDVSADGSTVVGYNRFSGPTHATGFIWTEETGMVDVEDFLADSGVVVDPDYDILDLTAISDDGTTIIGIGQWLVEPYEYSTFIIRLPQPEGCPYTCGDIDGSGGPVDLSDFAVFANCYGLVGPAPECSEDEFACSDVDADGEITLNDFATFAVLYGTVSTNSPPNCP